MNQDVPLREHLDRLRRVQSVACPKCGAAKGEACRSPQGEPQSPHHAVRYGKLYRQRARRS